MNDRKKKVDRLAFLGSLAGGLAHEIKNPLSTISVNLQLMKEDWEGAEGTRERRTVKRIEILTKEIERLEGIVNDFLTYARGFSLQPVEENINRIMSDMATFLDPEARRQGVQIRCFLDPALPLIPVDVKYFKLALINLLQNGLQALESHDGIKEILIRTQRSAGGAEVSITDTGPGIPAEHREKIFQVYFTTKRKGTGMGLATVKRIIEEHGGTITFQSDVGRGTSFHIFLRGAGRGPAAGEGDEA